MARINEIYDKMVYACENVHAVVDAQKAQGKKIVGVLPVYAPEELVHAAGMFPVGCWGGTTTISKAAKYFPPFTCSIMQSVMEFAENGTYSQLDAFLVSTPCDTLKCVSQNLIFACPDNTVIPITYPQNNKPDYALRYTQSELSKVKQKLEKLGGAPISDEALTNSIEVYNGHRAAMMGFFAAVAENPGAVSAVERHYVVKASYFMPKEEHTALVNELVGLVKQAAPKAAPAKKIMLAGIMAEPNNLLVLFDEFGLAVVADELAHEGRQFRTPVPEGGAPLERLARQWQDIEGCSVVLDKEKKRASGIAALAKQQGADAVVYCQMKFCDPEEFDYPSVKAACDKAGLAVLNLETDQLTETASQARTRIQAFREQLDA